MKLLFTTLEADLLALLNQGHSLAERNGENKTPRDVALEKDLQQHVDTIGKTYLPFMVHNYILSNSSQN